MLITTMKDHLYPQQELDHVRHTVRVFLKNECNEYLFLHIVGDDSFGMRNHLETIGGGIEAGESQQQAVIREVMEESGYPIQKLEYIGDIIDEYNLIHRTTHSHFYIADVQKELFGAMNRTPEEQLLVQEMVWIKQEEVEAALEPQKQAGTIGELIQRRDLAAFIYYRSLAIVQS